jgi:hypothetical protein
MNPLYALSSSGHRTADTVSAISNMTNSIQKRIVVQLVKKSIAIFIPRFIMMFSQRERPTPQSTATGPDNPGKLSQSPPPLTQRITLILSPLTMPKCLPSTTRFYDQTVFAFLISGPSHPSSFEHRNILRRSTSNSKITKTQSISQEWAV